MLASDVTLLVLPELQAYLPGDLTRAGGELEALLVADGRALDPLVYWQRNGDKVLVDGHRRFSICSKHELHFDLVEKAFRDIREVKYWMDCNQATRRNINAYERAEIVSRMDKYLEEEKLAGRFSGSVTEEIARRQNVSRRTIHRAKGQATALNSLPSEVKERIVSGELRISDSELAELVTLPNREIHNIVREVDEQQFESLGEAVSGVKDGPPLSQPGKQIKVPRKPEVQLDRIADEATRALGMLAKQIDALHELRPHQARFSNVMSNISNIRNSIINWGKDVR